ncbi:hypothetical protein CFOL_v3_02137 [Cephalotus follicularis]|uniref:LEA_2 domain-containing protein n=1 Tax=Cephalotus follicularis TaxID=3775 RepID=A0A1Q3ASG3_CEPFO|nr:hypothetical protein CFOL_v3_02137 [Cephalotus follicularis]
MEDLEARVHAPFPPLPKPPSRDQCKSSQRHVAFCEIPPKYQVRDDERCSDEESSRCRPCFFTCCAWTCLALCTLSLILLIVGVSFYAMVQSWLPEIRMEKISFIKTDFVNSSPGSPKMLALNAATDVVLQVSNKNENAGLVFGPLAVDVSWEEIKLGRANVPGFSLHPKNSTTLTLHSGVATSQVDKDDEGEIKTSLKNRDMMIDVFLTGLIGFNLGGLRMNGLPLQIVCQDINLSDVDLGRQPACDVKIFTLG